MRVTQVCDRMPSQRVGKLGPITERKAEGREEGHAFPPLPGCWGSEKVVPNLFISHERSMCIRKRIIAAHSAMASASTVATAWNGRVELDLIGALVRVDVHHSARGAAGEQAAIRLNGAR